MDNITYKPGMSIEELVKEVNNRLEHLRTMNDINNDNIRIIDYNFKRVFEEFDKLSGKIDAAVVTIIKDLQKEFKALKKDAISNSPDEFLKL